MPYLDKESIIALMEPEDQKLVRGWQETTKHRTIDECRPWIFQVINYLIEKYGDII